MEITTTRNCKNGKLLLLVMNSHQCIPRERRMGAESEAAETTLGITVLRCFEGLRCGWSAMLLSASRGGTGGAYIYTSKLQGGHGHGGARVQVARCGGVRPGDDDDDRSLPRERRRRGGPTKAPRPCQPACAWTRARTHVSRCPRLARDGDARRWLVG